jgi:acyl-CoA thioesterase-1
MTTRFCPKHAILCLCLAGAASADGVLEPAPAGAPKPRHPAFAKVEDAPGLPRVLLLGDSISIGYTLPVRERLKDVANVHRAPANCADTANGLRQLDRWLGSGKWDVIHFNFGLHDIKYLDKTGKYVPPSEGTQVASPEQYEKNLRELVRRLKKNGAALIFATSTPVPDGAEGRVKGDAARYNQIAVKIMQQEGVAINDLFTLASEKQAEIQLERNVHFTPQGYQLLAEQVAEKIRDALAGKIRVVRDVEFLEPDRAEKLDLYHPPMETEKKGQFPALVWIHGGGWAGGEKDARREQVIGGALARAGYVVASIDYKLGRTENAWPQNLLDCKNAVRFLRANAEKYNIDPGRIAVGGGSAGGHLALMVGLTAGQKDLEPVAPYPGVSSAVRCVLNFYGVTNLLTRRETRPDGTPTGKLKSGGGLLRAFGAKSASDPVLRLASPVSHINRSSVPVLTLHGRADTTVDYMQAEELDRELTKCGVPHETIWLDGIGHTFDLETWKGKKLPRNIKPDVLESLARYMK